MPKKQDSDEKELVRRSRAGSILAFDQLLSLYEKRIFAYLYRILNKRHDAEDLTQEVFIKVYKNLKTFKTGKEFSPWIYKIATNTAYDWLRKKRIRQEVALDASEADPFETIANAHPYKNIEKAQDLGKALSELKPIYRTVLLLYYYDDQSYTEIAEIVDAPVNTVKTYLKRAKENLYKILKQKQN